jgi:hypothetical protein
MAELGEAVEEDGFQGGELFFLEDLHGGRAEPRRSSGALRCFSAAGSFHGGGARIRRSSALFLLAARSFHGGARIRISAPFLLLCSKLKKALSFSYSQKCPCSSLF